MNRKEFNTKLVEKNFLRENIIELKLELYEEFDFLPGQFVNISVTPPYRRAYSIAFKVGSYLYFIVELIENGLASNYFLNLNIGSSCKIYGPLGSFNLKPTSMEKIFICTGTGIAPFISMLSELKKINQKALLLFGSREEDKEILGKYLNVISYPNLKIVNCVSNKNFSSDSENLFAGRVTKFLVENDFDMENSEFYLCGGPEMILDSEKILLEKNAKFIFKERFF